MLNFLSDFNEIIWTAFFLPGLFFTAVRLTAGCRGLQLRAGTIWKKTIQSSLHRQDNGENTLTSVQASLTALGSTVGTGNIVGTSQAIAMGGPGALFWMWAAAFASMIVKYAEVVLSINFRRSDNGYGPMDYMEHGLGKAELAKAYAFFAILSSFALGNITQASSMADSIVSAADVLFPKISFSLLSVRLSIGFFMSALSVWLLSGGAKRIAKASEILVPVMTVFFITASSAVVLANIKKMIPMFICIVHDAFHPQAALSGAVGITTAECVQWGVRRSAFSNEAGLGTSAIAHASSSGNSPDMEGLWGILEVFADTILICSLTGFTILCSGVDIQWGHEAGSELYCSALGTLFGQKTASVFVAVALCLFSYTSIISWSLYGKTCFKYLFGNLGESFFDFIFPLCVIFGCVMSTKSAWLLADLFNALMSVPNLIAVFLLSPTVSKISQDFFLDNKKRKV